MFKFWKCKFLKIGDSLSPSPPQFELCFWLHFLSTPFVFASSVTVWYEDACKAHRMFGKESLEACEIEASVDLGGPWWFAQPENLDWTRAEGSRSMRTEPWKGQFNSWMSCLWKAAWTRPALLADGSHSCPGPWSAHPRADSALTHALLWCLGSCAVTLAQERDEEQGSSWLALLCRLRKAILCNASGIVGPRLHPPKSEQ